MDRERQRVVEELTAHWCSLGEGRVRGAGLGFPAARTWDELGIQVYVDWLNEHGHTLEGELWSLFNCSYREARRRLEALQLPLGHPTALNHVAARRAPPEPPFVEPPGGAFLAVGQPIRADPVIYASDFVVETLHEPQDPAGVNVVGLVWPGHRVYNELRLWRLDSPTNELFVFRTFLQLPDLTPEEPHA